MDLPPERLRFLGMKKLHFQREMQQIIQKWKERIDKGDRT